MFSKVEGPLFTSRALLKEMLSVVVVVVILCYLQFLEDKCARRSGKTIVFPMGEGHSAQSQDGIFDYSSLGPSSPAPGLLGSVLLDISFKQLSLPTVPEGT